MAMTTPATALPTGPGGMPGYIWNLPAMPPPEGQASNFVNPESRDMELIVMNAVFLSATVVAVAVRFVARRTAKDVVGWDGVMCVLATMASAAHSGLMISGLDIGYGKHLWDIRAVTLTHSRLLQLNQLSTLYIVGICFAKLSVLLLYLRFFNVVEFTRHLIYFGIFLTLFTSAAFMGHEIAQAVLCMGVSAVTNQFCKAVNKVVTIQAAVNVFIDFYILVIPLQQVWKLNMDYRRKLGVGAVFGVGLVACIVSVVRMGWSIRNLNESDHFWAAVLTSEMTIVELNTVIIAPCLVFSPAFVKRSRSGLSSLRTRLVSSGQRTPSKDSLSDVYHDKAYSDAPKPQIVPLQFVTTPKDYIEPAKPAATHGR
ncbi:hypothetical protein COCVIDRAFT_25272 [Bipolaris victoriae FI3]|uniref:Rhodopsin domain-containing protein n=2 Tax=Bipolaris TaxID=33194 RepID=W6YU51_COCC2|nr:uncharacterized protein COCCADRAFT_35391 [Bipolaris zeicola 26-R-13]XP_014558167.1 hypothetical protein COCVIDRAFT_25272 [Bipolaris victoriae FI3]EUC35046.1 hypothetical protein COCCADRAFT_35391 [Bipolaris zeicola 26-R-13]